MVKVPQANRVKTRLVPPLTVHEAAALSCCFLRDSAANIAGVASAAASAVDGAVVYTPSDAADQLSGLLPEAFVLLAQRGESFGERLSNAAQDLLSVGYAGLCLINADSPTLPSDLLNLAVGALSRPGDRVVLGPSKDGGYYLIGLKRTHFRLFEEIEWSTAKVFAQTLDRARELGVEVEVLPEWYDVDSAAELSCLCEELFTSNGNNVVRSHVAYGAPYTRSYLARLIEAEGRKRVWPEAISQQMEQKA
jgi:rSAM/selenodomain-associated transferase 1